MPFDYSKIHFNSGLIVKELEKNKIKVKLLKDTNIIKATLDNHVELIEETDLSVMPAIFRHLFDNKYTSKILLKDNNLNIIEGLAFQPNEVQQAGDYAKQLEFPVVIKPVNCCHGDMVRMNIDHINEFKKIFSSLAEETNYKQQLLIEKQIEGNEFRLTVTSNGFFGAVFRIPPSVTGNGRDSLQKLIDLENKKRTENRINCLCTIYIDDEAKRYLFKKGLHLNYIPQKNERVFLRSNSNVSTGGDCLNVTEIVHQFYQNSAFKILNIFKGLPYLGIDLITDDITKKGNYHICEVNPSPGISLHTHPSQGKPQNLPKFLVDLIFPELKYKRLSSPKIQTIIDKKFKSIPSTTTNFQKQQNKKWFYKPVMLEIELTHRCNLRCKNCAIIEDIKKTSDLGLKVTDVQKILKEANEIGLYCYSITGGEPFLRAEDICRIISSEIPIDCYKIQTNGVVFADEKKTINILEKLKSSGFSVKNKYLKSSLRCSVGIQDENDNRSKYQKRIYNLSRYFYKIFDKEKANLSFLITHDIREDPIDIYNNFINEFQNNFGESFDTENIDIRTLPINFTAETKNEHDGIQKLPLKILLKEYAKTCKCFNDKTADAPWPKILLRANGDVYTCSRFGHVFKLGNINHHNLYELLETANQNKLFKLIHDKHLTGLLKEAEKYDSSIGNMLLPITVTTCQMCKILKNIIENQKTQYNS